MSSMCCRESYAPLEDLRPEVDFFQYQKAINGNGAGVASHQVIERYIAAHGQDYRWETGANPIPPLRDRTADNTRVGRVPGAER